MTASRLFVGNLSHDTTEEGLRTAFSAHGQVTQVHVVQDRYTGRSRGFAFVTMAQAAQATAAAQQMNGATLDGRALHVTGAETPGR